MQSISNEVKKGIKTIVVDLQTRSSSFIAKIKSEEHILNTTNMFKKRGVGVTSQATIKNMWKNEMREDVCKAIALSIYTNGIPFNVTNSEE